MSDSHCTGGHKCSTHCNLYAVFFVSSVVKFKLAHSTLFIQSDFVLVCSAFIILGQDSLIQTFWMHKNLIWKIAAPPF